MDSPLHQLSPEEKLLLSLCRLEFNERQKQEISELMKGISDWDHFVQLINEHGIIALSYHNIINTGNEKYIPPNYSGLLHMVYLRNLARNTYLYDQLANILGLIKRDDIKVVLLKGMALEKTIYGDQGLRQMSDIDVLVYPDKALELRRILIKNGFKSEPFKSPLYKFLIPYLNAHIPRLTKADCNIEVHYKVFYQKGNSLSEKIMEHSTLLNIEENSVFIPPSQLFFLYLISHLTHHSASGDSQIRLYTDIYLLISSGFEQIINKELIINATEANLAEPLACFLNLLNLYWGVEFPVWLNEFILKFDHTYEEEKFHIFLKTPNTIWGKGISSNYTKQVRIIPGLFRKTLFLAGFMLPSPAFMKKRYRTKTRSGAILYYVFRWFMTLKQLILRGYRNK